MGRRRSSRRHKPLKQAKQPTGLQNPGLVGSDARRSRIGEALASHPIVVGLGIIASIAGLVAFPFLWGNPWPWIEPEIRAATDAYPSPFTISNKSAWFDITELHVSCALDPVDYGRPNLKVGHIYSIRVYDLATTIEAGQHATFSCMGFPDLGIAPISATINLRIAYKVRWRSLTIGGYHVVNAIETYAKGRWIDGPII